MIAEHSPNKVLHLFDTFSGLPKPCELDSKKFRESDFNFKLDQVRNYLSGLHVVFHQGMFPTETGKEVENERFSFVHLDQTAPALECRWRSSEQTDARRRRKNRSNVRQPHRGGASSNGDERELRPSDKRCSKLRSMVES